MKYLLQPAYTILLLVIAFMPPVKGQENYTSNYNIYHGLPSNHIYTVVTDKYGYLWIATFNGVVKYNGYDFRVFGISNGLPTNDIWDLAEDKKGRLWLGNISDEIGYIVNDNYYKAKIKGREETIYPQEMKQYGDGIIFYRLFYGDNKYSSICITDKDTIKTYLIPDTILNKYKYIDTCYVKSSSKTTLNGIFKIPASRLPIMISNSWVFNVYPDTPMVRLKPVFKINDDYFEKKIDHQRSDVAGDYLLSYYFGHIFSALNLVNGEIIETDIDKYCKGETINYINVKKTEYNFSVITNKHILEFNCLNGIELKKINAINELTGDKDLLGDKVYAFRRDNFWKNITGSFSSGFYINWGIKNYFQPFKRYDLNNFELKGNISDKMSFWWNSAINTLLIINADGSFDKMVLKNITKINSINYYNRDTFLLNSYSSYIFIPKLHKLDMANYLFGAQAYVTIRDHHGNCYAIFSKVVTRKKNIWSVLEDENLDLDKYKDIQFDSLRSRYVAFSHNKMLIQQDGAMVNDFIKVHNEKKNTGVSQIEHLAIDNHYGNYFIKGADNLTMYNPDNNQYKLLLKNVNISDANLYLYHNLLIVAGRFGIAISTIEGPMALSESLIYHNIKNINYRQINSLLPCSDSITLTTDKGTYRFAIPSDSSIQNAAKDSVFYAAKFIYRYRDTIHNYISGDTAILVQTDRRLQFDVINPYGNGHLKYSYMFTGDSVWHDLATSEITLSDNFVPDKMYTITLKVNDDVWKSDPVLLNLYIQPYWLQTVNGRRIMWLIISLIIILVIGSAIIVTRKIVIARAKKRTMRLELELKAIYAQINPHFIFNTLNSALAMAKKNKMEDIYNHIFKFSSLLRGYIKSSRNKFITIAEEMENLSDYIELQQIRFKDKFTYEIRIQHGINPDITSIPSLLLQPFVENAINHGLLPLEKDGFIKIMFMLSSSPDELICIIDDNGIGRKKSKLIHETSNRKAESYGDLLIKDLVAIFNRYERMNISITYMDKEEPQSGTTVTIFIKNSGNVS